MCRYRGPTGPFQFAVVGTTYDFITWIAALGMFPCLFLAAPATILGGLYFSVRSPGWEKLHAFALALSFLALSMQIVIWGAFVWD